MNKILIFLLVLYSNISIGQLSPFEWKENRGNDWYNGFEEANKNPEKVIKLKLKNETLSFNNLQNYPNLRILDLSNSGLTKIPKEVFELEELEALNIGWNKLKNISDEISNLKNLNTLILDHNYFKVVPKSILKLKNLKCLHLKGSIDLEDVSESLKVISSISTLIELRFLHFDYDQQLTEIPEELLNLKDLKYLHIDATYLNEIPMFISEFSNLEQLYLGTPSMLAKQKEFEVMPISICSIPNLTHLYLRDIVFKSFPKEISNLSKLENLYFEMPLDFDTTSLKYLRPLPLKFLSLNFDHKTLPQAFAEIISIEGLYLQSTKLAILPNNIGNLTNLEYIIITDNNIENLPESFCQLSSLKKIEFVTDCYLQELPICFSNLNQLEYLDFGNCHNMKPPISIGEMKNLKYLNLQMKQGTKVIKMDTVFQWTIYSY